MASIISWHLAIFQSRHISVPVPLRVKWKLCCIQAPQQQGYIEPSCDPQKEIAVHMSSQCGPCSALSSLKPALCSCPPGSRIMRPPPSLPESIQQRVAGSGHPLGTPPFTQHPRAAAQPAASLPACSSAVSILSCIWPPSQQYIQLTAFSGESSVCTLRNLPDSRGSCLSPSPTPCQGCQRQRGKDFLA